MLVLTSMAAMLCVLYTKPLQPPINLPDRKQSNALSITINAAQHIQNFTLEHISIEQGFSDESVRCIMQDKQGFLWIGTEGGLNFYNGNKFTPYLHNYQDSTSLAHNVVTAVIQDHTGTIWLGTLNGLDRFCGVTRQFQHYRPALPNVSDDLQRIYALHQSSDQMFWMGTNRGLLRFAPHLRTETTPRGYWEHVVLPSRSSLETRSRSVHRNTRIFSVGSTKSNAIWCVSSDGDIWTIHPTTKHIKFVAETAALNPLLSQTAFRHDTLWVGTGEGVFCIDMSAERVVGRFLTQDAHPVTRKMPVVYAVCWSSAGLIWAGTDNGIYVIDPRTGQTQHFVHNALNPNGLRGNVITTIYEDRSGVMWIGDISYGLSKFAPSGYKFVSYKHNPINPNSLSNNYIRGMYEDQKGILWVGTQYGGLNRINRQTGVITPFQRQSNNPKSISSNNVWAIMQDQRGATRGDLWIGMDRKGGVDLLSPMQPEAGFRKFRANGFPEDVSVQVMYEDRLGNMWVGTWSDSTEIYRIAPDRSTVEAFHRTKLRFVTSAGKQLPDWFECVGVQSFYEDTQGRFWLGSNNGLFYFKPAAKEIVYYPLSEVVALQVQSPLRSTVRDFVTYIGETRDSTLWIATKGGGIYWVKTSDAERGRFAHLGTADGLPHDNVYAVLEDASGKLWASTDNGVCEYNRTTKTFRTFSASDGLQGREFNRRAFFQSASGEILFGGTNGLSSFFPERTVNNPYPPLAVIERVVALQSKNVVADVLAFGLPQTVELEHANNSIQLDVAAIEYTAPEQNVCSWKLEGFDEQWSEPTTNRSIVYTNLEPGTYTFRVIVANSDGVWNREGASLKIKILPAWWQLWWLRAAVAVLVAVGVRRGYVLRVRRVQERVERRNQELQGLVEERTKELQRSNWQLLDANRAIRQQLDIVDEQATKIELQHTALQEKNDALNAALLDLQRTQSQLIHSERMSAVGLLTAGIMHEINNPNAAVHSALEESQVVLRNLHDLFLSLVPEAERQNPLVQSFERFVAELQDMTAVALHGSERVRDVVANLRSFTKHQRSNELTGNIADELRSTVQMFRYQFKHVRVETTMPEELTVQGNIGELNQVFLNLLVNAAQADATCVVVTVEEQQHEQQGNNQRCMVLTVQDNGKGIAPELQQRIFEPFFSTKGVDNSGLGLSISKEILQKHGGSLDVTSMNGQGTTFVIRLML
jgi:signal transduction histidine kinase/ligand-binding sensor domain-containing protein